jgi:predicted secreted protein
MEELRIIFSQSGTELLKPAEKKPEARPRVKELTQATNTLFRPVCQQANVEFWRKAAAKKIKIYVLPRQHFHKAEILKVDWKNGWKAFLFRYRFSKRPSRAAVCIKYQTTGFPQ